MSRFRLVLVSGCLLVLATGAVACSVPVFRYALERWRHDRADEQFTLIVTCTLSDAHREILQALDPTRTNANWTLDLKPAEGEPRVVVRAPDGEQKPSFYDGPLDRDALLALADSPLRREITRKLFAGESVVWVLLGSGEAERDDAVAETVRKELDRLQTLLKIPPQDDDDESVLKSKVPLKVSFALVRLSRTDAAEAGFIRQLLTLDEDRTKETGPILVPIFGRGRMLTTLVGKELSPRVLEDIARFLCGACSCRVKKLNPGADLLWAADWDSILTDPPSKIEPPIPQQEPGAIVLTKPVVESVPSSKPASGEGWGRTLLVVGIGCAAALVLVTGWLALRFRFSEAEA